MTLTEKRKFGNEGEHLAETFLQSKGYRLVARQVAIPRIGEIDLIMIDRGTFVFVEVKARHDVSFGPPEEAVTRRKLRTLAACAELWRVRNGRYGQPWRMDVVAVDLSEHPPAIRHLEAVSID